MATTVILGGVTYTLLHCFDARLAYTTPAAAALSVIFLFFQYLGPGMIKTVLTLRTGNAWVHVWAYHAISPHTIVDAPLIAKNLPDRLSPRGREVAHHRPWAAPPTFGNWQERDK